MFLENNNNNNNLRLISEKNTYLPADLNLWVVTL